MARPSFPHFLVVTGIERLGSSPSPRCNDNTSQRLLFRENLLRNGFTIEIRVVGGGP